MRSILKIAGFAAAATMAGSASSAEPSEPIQVMVLGAYHMGNPGLDVNNARADDVLTPRRQRELEQLADALAEFKPTRVMVERVGTGTAQTPKSWTEFNAQKLGTERDETVQIAYRLAARLNVPVHGIDERDRPDEESYFPYPKLMAFAEARGSKAEIEALNGPIQAHIKKFEAAQSTQPVAALLAMWNDPAVYPRDMEFYYGVLGFAEGTETPGADLNARWYLRNARIFTNVMRHSVPGDRILIVYGSGHAYWLRHFARETPGYVNVDPLPYLKQAEAKAGR